MYYPQLSEPMWIACRRFFVARGSIYMRPVLSYMFILRCCGNRRTHLFYVTSSPGFTCCRHGYIRMFYVSLCLFRRSSPIHMQQPSCVSMPNKHETLTRCWANVGTTSQTADKHWPNTRSNVLCLPVRCRQLLPASHKNL